MEGLVTEIRGTSDNKKKVTRQSFAPQEHLNWTLAEGQKINRPMSTGRPRVILASAASVWVYVIQVAVSHRTF